MNCLVKAVADAQDSIGPVSVPGENAPAQATCGLDSSLLETAGDALFVDALALVAARGVSFDGFFISVDAVDVVGALDIDVLVGIAVEVSALEALLQVLTVNRVLLDGRVVLEVLVVTSPAVVADASCFDEVLSVIEFGVAVHGKAFATAFARGHLKRNGMGA